MGALTHKKNAFAMRVWESQSEYKLISKEVYFLVRVDKVKNRYARILPINLFMPDDVRENTYNNMLINVHNFVKIELAIAIKDVVYKIYKNVKKFEKMLFQCKNIYYIYTTYKNLSIKENNVINSLIVNFLYTNFRNGALLRKFLNLKEMVPSSYEDQYRHLIKSNVNKIYFIENISFYNSAIGVNLNNLEDENEDNYMDIITFGVSEHLAISQYSLFNIYIKKLLKISANFCIEKCSLFLGFNHNPHSDFSLNLRNVNNEISILVNNVDLLYNLNYSSLYG